MTQIYHITHINNLANIVNSGFLLPDNQVQGTGIQNTNIGHRHIKERRSRRKVKVASGGVLADYVPFYFAPRSPMLYVINAGGIEEYSDGQTPILHLVAELEIVVTAGKGYCFTDRHAELAWAKYYEDIQQLEDAVDWNIMRQRYWSNTDEEKEKRQAEFLVHQNFEWTFVQKIGVINAEIAVQVGTIFGSADHQPQIEVNPHWYYPC